MSKNTEAQTAPQKPDCTLTTQIDNQVFINKVFFDHDSKETFQEKLMRVILAGESDKTAWFLVLQTALALPSRGGLILSSHLVIKAN